MENIVDEFDSFKSEGTTEDAWLQGFDQQEEVKPPTLSEKKDMLVSSMLSGEDTTLQYRTLEASTTPERNAAVQQITDEATQHAQEVALDVSSSAYMRHEIPEEQALEYMSGTLSAAETKDYKEKLLVDKMIATEVVGETPAQEEARIARAADDVKAVIERQKIHQTLINSQLVNDDQGVAGAVADLFEYFLPMAEQTRLVEVVNALRTPETSIAEALTLFGNSKIDFQNAFLNMDWSQQEQVAAMAAAVIDSTEGLIMMDNGTMKADLYQSLTDPDHYAGGRQFLDNMQGVFDLIGVGSVFKTGRKVLGGAAAGVGAVAGGGIATGIELTEKAQRAARARFTSTGQQPNSVGRMADEANPDVAADLHVTAALDESGETSKVVYGGTEDTVAARELPQVPTEDGIVTSTPTHLSDRVNMQAKADGRFDLNAAEEESVVQFLAGKMEDTFGVTLQQELSHMPVRNADGTFKIDAVYGRPDSPFRNPKYAVEYVKVALRDFDLTNANFRILRKNSEGQYVPTTIDEWEELVAAREAVVKSKKKITDERLLKKNMTEDFQVRVEFDQVLDPHHVSYENTTVRKNFFDRVKAFVANKKGGTSLTRYLIDPHSMFDFRITGGANQAFDKAAGLEKELIDLSQPFIEGFKKLSSDRRQAVEEAIKLANFKSEKFDRTALRAEGFSTPELELLDNWKEAWDNIYLLENKDLVGTLRGQGLKLLSTDDWQFFVRPVSQDQSVGKLAFDPATGETVRITQEMAEGLYSTGGQVAKNRQSFKLEDGGDELEYVLAHNSVGTSTIREFRESDKLLNYREGYSNVRYQDPYFVIMNRSDLQAGGKAIKTAGDSQTAAAFVRQMNESAEEGVTYTFRPARDLEPNDFTNMSLELMEHSGRLSHRKRGKRLGSDNSEMIVAPDGTEDVAMSMGRVMEPIDGLLNSIRSIAKRTSTRGFIERYKERVKSQYGHLFPEGKSFPDTADELIVRGTLTNKELADARSHIEYINSLEYGYRNALDDTYKSVMNATAEIVGNVSPALEKGVRAVNDAVPAPARALRARSFETGIALNPFRQLVIQSHQSIMLTANFPKYVFTQMPRDMAGMLVMSKWRKRVLETEGDVFLKFQDDLNEAARLTGRSVDEISEMSDAWMRSGLSAGVDKSTLLDEGFDSLITGSKASKAWAAMVKYPRKGFDAGEKVNLMTAWLSHYDKARGTAGKTLTQKQLDEVSARARNYTLNMNQAGEPPYNKNSFSMAFQYMQVPHKSFTQIFNRGLTKAERAKLAAVHLAVLPMPPTLGYSVINYFSEASGVEIDEGTRYALMNGLEGMFLNKAMSLMTGEESSSDWSSLASFDPNAPYELVKSLMTGNFAEILAATPSGSLFMGHNPRIANMATELSRFISPPSGEDRDLGVLLETFANYSSGVANFSKSMKALQVRKFYNSTGGTSDADVSKGEAIAKAFGFRSFEEAMNYEVKQHAYTQGDDFRNDIKEFVKLQSQALARRGITQDERDYMISMTSMFNQTELLSSQAGKELYWSEIERQARKNDNGMLKQIMATIKYEDPVALQQMAATAGYGKEFAEVVEHIKNVKDESGEW